MNVMTKRGSIDNVVTYEHFCDTKQDLDNIPASQITLGSTAIVLQDTDGMGIYIANSSKEWVEFSVGSGNAAGAIFDLDDRIKKGTNNNGEEVEGAIIEGDITGNKAQGTYSHAEGTSTIANGESQHVSGKYNIADTTSAEIIGNGTSSTRSNARTLDWNGNEWLAGGLTAAGGTITIGSTTITEQQLIQLLATLNS